MKKIREIKCIQCSLTIEDVDELYLMDKEADTWLCSICHKTDY